MNQRGYEIVAPLSLFAQLRALRPHQRRAIELVLRRLADRPATPGDIQAIDADGRRQEIAFVAGWAVRYWADHAVRELRFVSLTRRPP